MKAKRAFLNKGPYGTILRAVHKLKGFGGLDSTISWLCLLCMLHMVVLQIENSIFPS